MSFRNIQTLKTRHFVIVAALVAVLGCLHLQNNTRAASRLLPFQGRLTDAQGNAIADGPRVVQFKIYDAPIGGQVMWNGEVQKLTVNAGLVSTLLGTKANFSGVDFNRDVYLELTVDSNNDGHITAADPPLLPRQSVIPTVFAVEAGNSRLLGNHDWSALFGVNDPVNGKLHGSKIQTNSITGAQIAPGSLAPSEFSSAAISAFCPVGSIIASMMPYHILAEEPGFKQSWVPCDGKILSGELAQSKYAQRKRLEHAQRATPNGGWRVGDVSEIDAANQVRVPDLRGQFLRGLNSFIPGDSRADGKGEHTDYGADRVAGSWQTDMLKWHRHWLPTVKLQVNHASPANQGAYNGVGITDRWADSAQFGQVAELRITDGTNATAIYNGSRSATAPAWEETQPKNVSIYWYIRVN